MGSECANIGEPFDSLRTLRAIAYCELKVVSERSESNHMYFFYILLCSDNSLYCGMTRNLENRLKEHNSDGKKEAKYLRGKKPVILIYSEQFNDIISAMRRELQIKKWSKVKKEALARGDFELLKNL